MRTDTFPDAGAFLSPQPETTATAIATAKTGMRFMAASGFRTM
jgi:hypothetical protein